MRPFSPQYVRSINQSIQTTTRSQLSKRLSARMSTNHGELNIENTNISTYPDVKLSDQQKTLVGSVLDLFAGRPSLAKLQLWKDDATFSDPLTIAKGRDQYQAQWYGLQTAFSEIERISHQVTSSGNPIEMDMTQRYKVKGIGSEQTISSKVFIHHDGDKITKVEDKWNGKLPEGGIAQAFRRLNAVTVPHIVGVPKDAEEDAKKGN
ncbi:hypothetical protein BDY17DRAFT_306112 [Neohortaea acidophila]|uniref:SnoaL-like domain-containing protein n=1 Tax=Neohortaea acidophila TaxID=245834 RepID=A0A6A6PFN5_9PEZI|nr:uncharacterized protein BDY17DRAFT_306112 [Neohortaea acidophila]KAF2478531.1 hypothetical protein BDY17DRAFT_306112 [Neohortaea acidophila]